MQSVSAAFIQGCAVPHQITSYVEFWSPDGGTLLKTTQNSSTVALTKGTVTYDKQSDVRSRVQFDLADASLNFVPTSNGDALTPYGNEVKVYTGIEFATGTSEYCYMGTFRMTDVEVTDNAGGVTINVTAQDRSRTIARNINILPYLHPYGVSYAEAIQAMLQTRYPSIQFNDTAANWKLLQNDAAVITPLFSPGQNTGLSEGTNFWAEARKMAKSVGCELYFDRFGICFFIRDPAFTYTTGVGLTPVYSFTEGTNATFPKAIRKFSDQNGFNEVIITGEGNLVSGLPFRSLPAQDLDVTSPTYISGPYGVVPLMETADVIATQIQLDDFAQLRLRQQIGGQEAVTISAIPAPFLDPDDVVSATRTRLGLNNANYIVDKLDVPLASADQMQVTLRARRAF